MEAGSDETSAKALEKRIRILTKKLERSEADRQQLEEASELRERILKGVIREFEASQMALEKRSRELEIALGNLKTLQVKLIESEKMSALGILIAGIAHEINNPLAIISSNILLLDKFKDDPEKFASKVSSIQRSAERISKIVKVHGLLLWK